MTRVTKCLSFKSRPGASSAASRSNRSFPTRELGVFKDDEHIGLTPLNPDTRRDPALAYGYVERDSVADDLIKSAHDLCAECTDASDLTEATAA